MDKLLPIEPDCEALYLPTGQHVKVINRIMAWARVPVTVNGEAKEGYVKVNGWLLDRFVKDIEATKNVTAPFASDKELMRIDGFFPKSKEITTEDLEKMERHKRHKKYRRKLKKLARIKTSTEDK